MTKSEKKIVLKRVHIRVEWDKKLDQEVDGAQTPEEGVKALKAILMTAIGDYLAGLPGVEKKNGEGLLEVEFEF
jgi:hypothetical protein